MLHVIALTAAYLLLLFAVATGFQRRGGVPRLRLPIYVLAAGVYCTSWTVFGSVQMCLEQGLGYLVYYVGPLLALVLAPVILSRMLRYGGDGNIYTVTGLLVHRYQLGGVFSGALALVVTCWIAVYIALQLRTIGISLLFVGGSVLEGDERGVVAASFVVGIALATFAVIFAGRNTDWEKPQHGLMAAMALESVVKAGLLLVAGGVVATVVLPSLQSGPVLDELGEMLAIRPPQGTVGIASWPALITISFAAFLLLPRQYHVLVVGGEESGVKPLAWGAALYLLLLQPPVIFVALVARRKGLSEPYVVFELLRDLPGLGVDLGWVPYLAGLSAGSAMVCVATVALGRMLADHVVAPLTMGVTGRAFVMADMRATVLASMAFVIAFSWGLVAVAPDLDDLASWVNISFSGIAQLLPPVLAGLFWRRTSRRGAIAGLLVGFGFWALLVVAPEFSAPVERLLVGLSPRLPSLETGIPVFMNLVALVFVSARCAERETMSTESQAGPSLPVRAIRQFLERDEKLMNDEAGRALLDSCIELCPRCQNPVDASRGANPLDCEMRIEPELNKRFLKLLSRVMGATLAADICRRIEREHSRGEGAAQCYLLEDRIAQAKLEEEHRKLDVVVNDPDIVGEDAEVLRDRVGKMRIPDRSEPEASAVASVSVEPRARPLGDPSSLGEVEPLSAEERRWLWLFLVFLVLFLAPLLEDVRTAPWLVWYFLVVWIALIVVVFLRSRLETQASGRERSDGDLGS